MAETVKVTRKYQVTIPKNVRRTVGVKIGDRLKASGRGKNIVLKKAGGKESLVELAGCWRGYPEDLEGFMKELRRMWSTWRV